MVITMIRTRLFASDYSALLPFTHGGVLIVRHNDEVRGTLGDVRGTSNEDLGDSRGGSVVTLANKPTILSTNFDSTFRRAAFALDATGSALNVRVVTCPAVGKVVVSLLAFFGRRFYTHVRRRRRCGIPGPFSIGI